MAKQNKQNKQKISVPFEKEQWPNIPLGESIVYCGEPVSKNRNSLRKEIEQSINKHNGENRSNTPDFILAEYLMDCLETFDRFVNKREAYYLDANNKSDGNG